MAPGVLKLVVLSCVLLGVNCTHKHHHRTHTLNPLRVDDSRRDASDVETNPKLSVLLESLEKIAAEPVQSKPKKIEQKVELPKKEVEAQHRIPELIEQESETTTKVEFTQADRIAAQTSDDPHIVQAADQLDLIDKEIAANSNKKLQLDDWLSEAHSQVSALQKHIETVDATEQEMSSKLSQLEKLREKIHGDIRGSLLKKNLREAQSALISLSSSSKNNGHQSEILLEGREYLEQRIKALSDMVAKLRDDSATDDPMLQEVDALMSQMHARQGRLGGDTMYLRPELITPCPNINCDEYIAAMTDAPTSAPTAP